MTEPATKALPETRPGRLPLVTVGITAYNHAAFIEQCLRSVAEQDYPELQIILADDASKDDTVAVARRVAAEVGRPVLILSGEPNLGNETLSRNRILPHAKGEYLVLMDGDDLLLPGKLRAQVELMESRPDAAACYHDVEVFDDRQGTRFRYATWVRPREGTAREVVRHGVFATILSILYRRRAVEPLPASLPWASDWLMLIRAGRAGRILYIDQVLARYRRHAASSTASGQSAPYPYLTLALVEANHPDLLANVPAGRARLFLEASAAAMRRGDRRQATAYARAALRLRALRWRPAHLAWLWLLGLGLEPPFRRRWADPAPPGGRPPAAGSAAFRPVDRRLKVLVTGASGFLGQAVVRRLADSHDVVQAGRKQGIDVRDAAALRRLAQGCDAVVHLAALVRGTPEDLVATNVEGTRNALQAATAANAAFVLASSAGAAEPRTPYGRSKADAERLVEAAAGRLPGAAILRFFNLYGDGDPRGVVARFLREDPLVIEGDGSAVRDFLHVDDAADAIARSLRPQGLVRSDVGTARGLSVLELAKLFNKPIVHGPAPKDQIMHSVAEPCKIPGWEPKVRLEDWLRDHRRRGAAGTP